MMKRILSLLLALLMLASMVPGGVFATDETVPETVEEMVEETTEAVTEPTEVPAEVPTEAPTEAATLPTEAVLEAAMLEEELVEEIVEETVGGTVGDIMPESTVPAIVSNDFCPWCEETLAEDGSVIHAVNCKAAFAYDGSADVGRFVRLVAVDEEYSVDVSGDPVNEESLIFYVYEFGEDIVMRVTDWYWDAESTELWYRVELFRGAFPEGMEDYPWPETPWILQCYTDPVADYPPVLEFVNICEVCGKENCEVSHFTCEICGNVRCDLPHPYCNLCNVFDCTQTHTWCGTCGCYDCVLEHGEPYRPMLEPVIPENPVLTEGAAVSITDETGNPVTESGIFLEAGTHSSISAWGETEEASFQWQIRYDSANDSWINIRGQNGRGIVLSPAMFMSLLESQGSAAVRCVMSTENSVYTSASIPVDVLAAESVSLEEPALEKVAVFAAAHSIEEPALSEIDDTEEGNETTDQTGTDVLQKVNLVVQYHYEDNRIAAATDTFELHMGSALKQDHTLPVIPGYKAQLLTHEYGSSAVQEGGILKLDFQENELMEEYTVLTVEYQPDYVNYTVIRYKQNIYDDNYVEFSRETIGDRYKTGQTIENAHLIGDDQHTLEGFQHLIYDTPKAAADGSTVIEVYYDRNYYLIQFELGGGYGVNPIYDRYEADVAVAEPTRAGYDFEHWLDENGTVYDSIPNKVTDGNHVYTAVWKELETEYAVAYWVSNADGSRSLIGTHLERAVAGSTVYGYNFNNLGTNDGLTCNEHREHIHSKACYECDPDTHTHTLGCFPSWKTNVPGPDGEQVIKNVKDGKENPESGYVYVIQTSAGLYWPKLYLDGQYYTINGVGEKESDATWERAQTVIWGDPIGEPGEYNGLRATKYKARPKCTAHVHNESCYKDTTYLEYIAPGTANETYTTDADVVIEGDGSTVVNVYYKYKEYTLKFYYAASEKGTGNTTTYKIVGGTTYYFGSWAKENQVYSVDDEDLLYNQYVNWSGQWGTVDELPSLNTKGTARGYHPDSDTYTWTVVRDTKEVTLEVTFYYISFKARYGDNISNLWPCDVFESVTRTTDNTHGYWSGKEAFVSAWNGEQYVKYSQDKANETIKGVYERLDENLLLVPEYENETEVSYLCFWENGANIWWSVPELYRYNIYLEEYPHQDLSNETTVVKDGVTYYRADWYDTFDDSDPWKQTQPSLKGYRKVAFTKAQENYTRHALENTSPTEYCESRVMEGTNDKTMLENPEKYPLHYDSSLYARGYSINFYYDAIEYNLSFWNHDGPLRGNGGGSDVNFNEPLEKYFEGITVGGITYEGANDLIAQDAYYPKSLEKGAYEFDAWYTSPNFEPDTKVDPEKMVMPAEAVIMYAHWVPVKRTVSFYLTKDSMLKSQNRQTLPEEIRSLWADIKSGEAYPSDSKYDRFATQQVLNGSKLEEIESPAATEQFRDVHPRYGYDFVGWFYLDEGKETAFDPDRIAVVRDLELYAKWSSNKYCTYNVYFAVDNVNNETGEKKPDGVADLDENGNIIYIAAPITGTALAGQTRTFEAKGMAELADGYKSGYFPTVGSHSWIIDIRDEKGENQNSFTFLYQNRGTMPYTVRYLEKETEKVLADAVTHSDNDKILVTEYFKPITGYMPDAYQKTLPVSTNEAENVITFWYEKDEVRSMYAVNYYIQELDADLNHKRWRLYDDLQSDGLIGTEYSAEAIQIDGFTLSKTKTDEYNQQKISGFDNSQLPTEVSELTDNRLSGTLVQGGMELNFYYTRNLYPYEFRYMLNGTTESLCAPTVGKAAYDTVVTKVAENITLDLDGDGNVENFQLYDPTQATKDLRIIVDGTPLTEDAVVTAGQAKVNIATFYYVRCTQDMTIRKVLVDKGQDPAAVDFDQAFTFQLKIHAQSGYHRNEYEYEKSGGETGKLNPQPPAQDTLEFTLKHNESITIKGLPTAKYTVSELDLPLAYYDSYAPAKTNTLTVDGTLDVTVTNTYQPAALEISKEVVEPVVNGNSAVTEFEFKIEVPQGVTGTYAYTLDTGKSRVEKTASVSDGVMSIELKKGERAAFENLPEGSYEVTEEDYTVDGYSTLVYINGSANGQEKPATVILKRNETNTVVFRNSFLTGNLTIQRKEAADNNQVFVYNVYKTHNQESVLVCTVTVTGNSRTTIHYLPVGEYNVVEMESWSWRYPNPRTEQVTIEENQTALVVFSQIREKNNWLDGLSRVEVNTWGEAKQ